MYLQRAVDSVFAQTVQDIECLVVDDGSTDNTIQRLESLSHRYGESRFRKLHHPNGVNLGVSASRNLGIQHAKAEFIAFLDADDYWHPEKLEKQLSVFNLHSDVGVVFSFIEEEYMGKSESDAFLTGITRKWNESISVLDTPSCFTEILIAGNVIGSATPLVRASFLKDLRFEAGMQSLRRKVQFEDWLMWLKLSSRTLFYCISQPLAVYRIHDAQHTESFVNMRRGTDHIWGSYEVFASFLEDASVANNSEYRAWEAISKRALNSTIQRYLIQLGWLELWSIREPCQWADSWLRFVWNRLKSKQASLRQFIKRRVLNRHASSLNTPDKDR
jgi:glycosyltransferase involved in cell wall biosynthesis